MFLMFWSLSCLPCNQVFRVVDITIFFNVLEFGVLAVRAKEVIARWPELS